MTVFPPSSDPSSLESFAARIQELVLWLRDEGHVLSPIDQHLVERWWDAGYPLEVVLAVVRESGERLKRRKSPPRGLPLKAMNRSVVRAGEKARNRAVGGHGQQSGAVAPETDGGQEVLEALARDLEGRRPDLRQEAASAAEVALRELSGAALGEAELFSRLLGVGRLYYDALWGELPLQEQNRIRSEVRGDLADAFERMAPQAVEETVEELCRRRLRQQDPLFDPERYWRVA